MRETRLDILSKNASAMAALEQVSIAREPRCFADSSAPHLADVAASFPMQELVDFAAQQHNVPQSALQSMGLVLYDKGGLTTDATALYEPMVHEERIRYPVIRLNLHHAKSPTFLNANLRHEVRHFFQPNVTPLYNRIPEAAQRAAKYVGGTLLTACAISTLKNGSTIPDSPSLSAAANVLSLASLRPQTVAWMFSAQEWDAHLFARRTRNFTPFSG